MKNKEKIDFRCCCHHEKDVDIEKPLEVTANNKKYVMFGETNQFPAVLQQAVDNCATLGTTANTMSRYICGSSIEGDVTTDNTGEMLSELLEKLVYDYVCYGAFAVQILRNKEGKIARYVHVPVSQCRLDEDEDSVFISERWSAYSRDIKKYNRWKSDEQYPNSIFYVKNPKSVGLYGKPIWVSSLRDALTCVEASKANFNSIKNQFQPNVLINFANGIPDDDTKDAMEDAILDKYSGSDGSKILLTWSDSADTAPSVQTINVEDYTDRYNAILKTCRENIIAAFSMSPQLTGLNPEDTGFNSIEYTNAFALYKVTMIKPIQRFIEKQMAKIGLVFTFNDFEVTFSESGEKVEI